MGKLKFTPRALADLEEIWRTIALDNISAPERLVSRIYEQCRAAADFPKIGPARPELSPSARILVVGKYIAIYEPQPDGVTILAVVHGMRDPKRWLH